VKAVVDTNVFASGIFWKGKPELVINAWVEGGHVSGAHSSTELFSFDCII
jgi:predicted nucleic acid-binding protein